MICPGIVDTTLRDGEQAPGVAFSLREKVTIAKLLDRLGVDVIEAGVPVMGGMEQEALRVIGKMGLRARVISWNRLLLADIRASLACDLKDIHISVPVSDLHIIQKLGRSRQWVLDCLKRAMRYALDYGCRVSVGAEDASRADSSFLLEFALLAQEMGAERLRFADTVGVLEPFSTFSRIKWLNDKLSMAIEFHGHNDFGMATANTLAAVKAGAQYVDTTIGGLGERAGNTSLENFLMAMHGVYGVDTRLDQRVLLALRRYVAVAANRPLPESIGQAPRDCKRSNAESANKLQRRVHYA